MSVGDGGRDAAQHVNKGQQEFSVLYLTDISHNTLSPDPLAVTWELNIKKAIRIYNIKNRDVIQ